MGAMKMIKTIALQPESRGITQQQSKNDKKAIEPDTISSVNQAD